MKIKQPFYFSVVVWGKQFCDYLTDYCIPSLLASNNIPKLQNSGKNKFIICTTPEDWEVLQKHFVIIQLKQFLEVFWIEIPAPPLESSSCEHMGIGHKLATELCFEHKAYGILLTPDMLVSNGTMEAVQNHALAGKEVVLCAAFRFAEEPFFKGLEQVGLTSPLALQAELNVSSRQLVRLCLKSFHSETESYDFESPNYTFLRAVAFWRMPNHKGLLIHSLSWAPLLIDYNALSFHDTSALESWTIDGDYIYKNMKDHNKIYISQDSDELMIISWSPTNYNQLKVKKNAVGSFSKRCFVYRNRIYLRKTLANPIFDPLKLKLFYMPVYWHVDDIDHSWEEKEAHINRLLRKAPHPIIQHLFYYPPLLFHYIKKIIQYSIIALLACFGNKKAKQKLLKRMQILLNFKRRKIHDETSAT